MMLVQTIGISEVAMIGHSTRDHVGALPRANVAAKIQSDHGAWPMNQRSRRRPSDNAEEDGDRMIAAAVAICRSGTKLQQTNPLRSSPSVRCPVEANEDPVPRTSATSTGRLTARPA